MRMSIDYLEPLGCFRFECSAPLAYCYNYLPRVNKGNIFYIYFLHVPANNNYLPGALLLFCTPVTMESRTHNALIKRYIKVEMIVTI